MTDYVVKELEHRRGKFGVFSSFNDAMLTGPVDSRETAIERARERAFYDDAPDSKAIVHYPPKEPDTQL